MKKFKINYDRPRPSSEDILSRRNFDGLLSEYKAAPKVVHRPFWKSAWFSGSLVAAAVVTAGIIVYVNTRPVANPRTDSSSSAVISSTPATRTPGNSSVTASAIPAALVQKRRIAPPLKNTDVPFTHYHVNAATGGVFKHPSGSELTIPAGAFVDKDGNAVNGNVEIRYREFRDQVDFFLSGIPMQYDSAGTTYPFESAGMMEISAFVNGKVVYLKKDKPLKIRFASKGADNRFNLYRFDTTSGNWEYLGKDNVEKQQYPKGMKMQLTQQPQEPLGQLAMQYEKDLLVADSVNPVPIPPLQPRRADKKKNNFTVAFDANEFPEMQEYKDVVWEVDESQQKFDRDRFYKTTWDNIRLSHGDDSIYIITLTHGIETEKLVVYPVFQGKQYDDAMKVYTEKYAAYSAALKKRTAAEKQVKDTYEKNTGSMVLSPVVAAEVNPPGGADHDAIEKVMHVFTVSGFGIYNCDRPDIYPKGAVVNVDLLDETGTGAIAFATSYLVDRHKMGLYYYGGNPVAGMQFDPHSSSLLWAVKDGILYYADNDQFRKLPVSGSGELHMHRVEHSFQSPEEMKKFFRIPPGV